MGQLVNAPSWFASRKRRARATGQAWLVLINGQHPTTPPIFTRCRRRWSGESRAKKGWSCWLEKLKAVLEMIAAPTSSSELVLAIENLQPSVCPGHKRYKEGWTSAVVPTDLTVGILIKLYTASNSTRAHAHRGEAAGQLSCASLSCM